MPVFRLLTVLLMVGLLTILAYDRFVAAQLITPVDLGNGPGFSDSMALPKETVEHAIDQARSAMRQAHATGVNLKRAADVAALLTFLATSIVTLILGWFGRPPAPPAPELPAAPSIGSRPARWIGFLAALAAVLTGLNHFAAESAQSHFAAADQLRSQINQTWKDVLGTQSPADAQAAIDALLNQLGK